MVLGDVLRFTLQKKHAIEWAEVRLSILENGLPGYKPPPGWDPFRTLIRRLLAELRSDGLEITEAFREENSIQSFKTNPELFLTNKHLQIELGKKSAALFEKLKEKFNQALLSLDV